MGSKKLKIARVTPEKILAVELALEGKTSAQIGEVVGKHESTVRLWLKDPAVQEAARDILSRQVLPMIAKARRNLNNDLESEAANGYLRQNATFFALNRYEKEFMGESENKCQVFFANGVPELGMPDPTDEDE